MKNTRIIDMIFAIIICVVTCVVTYMGLQVIGGGGGR